MCYDFCDSPIKRKQFKSWVSKWSCHNLLSDKATHKSLRTVFTRKTWSSHCRNSWCESPALQKHLSFSIHWLLCVDFFNYLYSKIKVNIVRQQLMSVWHILHRLQENFAKFMLGTGRRLPLPILIKLLSPGLWVWWCQISWLSPNRTISLVADPWTHIPSSTTSGIYARTLSRKCRHSWNIYA